MKRGPDYRRSTNAAYELLIEARTFSLSTDVFAIVNALLKNCKLLSYSQACFLYGFSIQQLLGISEYGFSLIASSGKRVILYNEATPLRCIRFTIAHEIGHCVLGHMNEDDPDAEKEANCFARNLLCPLPVAEYLNATTVKDYTDLFSVTEQMATVTLRHRDSDGFYLDHNLAQTVSDMLEAYLMGFECLDEYLYYLAS